MFFFLTALEQDMGAQPCVMVTDSGLTVHVRTVFC